MSKVFVCNLILMSLLGISSIYAEYHIGIGIADCTGPSAEIVFMGYAKSKQKGCGIHLRQFSRAFVFYDGTNRAAFVTVDAAMMAHGIKKEVLRQLHTFYNDTYNEQNLILSGTHTHGTPGGFLMDLMFDIPNFGFVKETYHSLVNGILKSIVKAHENMVEAKIYFNTGELMNANINRSPTSYLLNPSEERDKYEHNVDKTLTQLKFVRASDNTPIGSINWFPVHATSMNNTNCLVTSDNLGYASVLFEKYLNKGSLPGKGSIVGAFASTSSGDVSPNLNGPRCLDTGERCDNVTSTCNGKTHFCVASGPGKDMFESTKIIAERVFNKALELWKSNEHVEIKGPIKFIHQFVNMPNQTAEIQLSNGTTKTVHGCLPAMGYSFAAGTTDGPGEFDFSQGTISSNKFWNTIRDFIFQPTPEDIACHHPKPILINTGRISVPYEWQPQVVATQVVMIGDLVLIAVPGEFTTMSGRRLREAVRQVAIKSGSSRDVKPIIAGLSNIYTSYIATPEEYQLQRYEGASTIYGPYTLNFYLNKYRELTTALLKDEKLDPGPSPPDFSSSLISLVPPVFFDSSSWSRKFGDCIEQPPMKVARGDAVSAKFVSGHPRNNVMHGKSFLTVEKQVDNDWEVIATDADWETKFIWKRTNKFTGGSEATTEWQVGRDIDPGLYRFRHFGYFKYIWGGTFPYQGTSNSFQVV